MEQNIKPEITLELTEKTINELLSLALSEKRQEKSENNPSVAHYKSVIAQVSDAIRNNKKAKVKFKDVLKSVKYIQAFNATPSGIPTGRNMFCVSEYVQDFVFDVLPTINIPRETLLHSVNTITNMQSSGIPDRSVDSVGAPIAQNSTKRLYNVLQSTTNVSIVKIAYQELVSLEAERTADGLEYITSHGMQKLMEIVHYYILHTLASGATALTAAAFPGAGTYQSPTLIDAFEWFRQRYLYDFGSDCRENVYIFLPASVWSRYVHTKDGFGRYFIEGFDYRRAKTFIDQVKVFPHYVSPEKTNTTHALNGTNNIMITSEDGQFIYVDPEVIVYEDHLYQTNQTALTFEVFVGAARLPQLTSPMFLSGSPSPLVVTSLATITSNI